MTKKYPTAKSVDVCLIVEGSYPFILGGVSAWTHKIIQAFSDYEFAVIFLGSRLEDYKKGMVYELPKNVTHFEVHYLFDESTLPPVAVKENTRCFKQMRDLHEIFKGSEKNICNIVDYLNFYLDVKNGISQEQFLFGKESWNYITEQYTKYSSEPSFIDYVWTVKNIHKPLWVLPEIINQLPKAKIFHTLSTGYAGFLGALLHHKRKRPLILTEHGIYTKERRIEILGSQIFREQNFLQEEITDISYLKRLWNQFFEMLAKICYDAADPIVSLFPGANAIQIEDGAQKQRTMIIPNGIDVDFYSQFSRSLAEKKRPVIGFIGRIVPIKDLKTLIRSISIVKNAIENVEAWLIGPTEEDPLYLQECQDLIISLELENYVKIIPNQDLSPIYPQLKVAVLSSISEGMPLVILECNAAGIPVIATDVGACRELIQGNTDEDKSLGASGAIVKIADPGSLAAAIIELLKNGEKWEAASANGKSRAKKYYDQQTMFATYRKIYQAGFN